MVAAMVLVTMLRTVVVVACGEMDVVFSTVSVQIAVDRSVTLTAGGVTVTEM